MTVTVVISFPRVGAAEQEPGRLGGGEELNKEGQEKRRRP
jgi:hypothetical protein